MVTEKRCVNFIEFFKENTFFELYKNVYYVSNDDVHEIMELYLDGDTINLETDVYSKIEFSKIANAALDHSMQALKVLREAKVLEE